MPSKMEKTKCYFWSLYKKQKGNLDVVQETFYVFRFFGSASSGIFLETGDGQKCPDSNSNLFQKQNFCSVPPSHRVAHLPLFQPGLAAKKQLLCNNNALAHLRHKWQLLGKNKFCQHSPRPLLCTHTLLVVGLIRKQQAFCKRKIWLGLAAKRKLCAK